MGLKGKLVTKINIKSDANAFYKLGCRPCDTSNICPNIVQSCDLLGGQWGAVGSVFSCNCCLGGKKMTLKEIIEDIDEAKKSITYKVIEGDLLHDYNTFKIILNMDCNGEDNLVTWTVEYEKKSGSVPEPHAFMDVLVTLTKEIECNHLLVPN